MDDETTTDETTGAEGPQDQEHEPTATELESAFEAGFDGGDPDAVPELTGSDEVLDGSEVEGQEDSFGQGGEETEVPSTPPAGDEPGDSAKSDVPQVEPDPIAAQLAAMEARLRKAEGNVGRLRQDVMSAREATTAQGGDQPTDEQVSAAFGSTEAFKQLEANFPEFAEAMRAEMSAMGSGGGQSGSDFSPADFAEVARAEARSELVEDAHRGWVDTVKSPEFVEWQAAVDAETQALGNSDRASDAIKMLDRFEEFRAWRAGLGDDGSRYTTSALLAMKVEGGVDSASKSQDPANAAQKSKQSRLRKSVPATSGSRTEPDVGGDDEESAFLAGFKTGRGTG